MPEAMEFAKEEILKIFRFRSKRKPTKFLNIKSFKAIDTPDDLLKRKISTGKPDVCSEGKLKVNSVLMSRRTQYLDS